MALNTYSCLATINLSLRDKSHSVPLRTIQPWEATLIIIHIGQGLRWLRVRQPFPLFPRCCPLRTPTQAGSL